MTMTVVTVSLEEFIAHPPDQMEWVNGNLVEKTGMTLKHGRIQSNLAFYWKTYTISSSQGGEVYTEAPCRTTKQARRPDVAYLTPELVAQFGESAVLPQSFPLVAEVASPTDSAEDLFAKAREYLQSGCEEVWLIFPESSWIFVITQNQRHWFIAAEVVRTQTVLKGFSVAMDELLA